MKKLLANNRLILMEAAIVEQLRRANNVTMHPSLVNAPLIYDTVGRLELAKPYESYIGIALSNKLPFLMCSPTWRANYERVMEAQARSSINSDAIKFLKEIREDQGFARASIKIGGMIGCKNDCYQPDEGLTTSESEKFHTWQVKQLASEGVDFLIAVTLPNVEEAVGIALAMEKTGIPYIISFVIGRDSRVLDGTSLMDAIKIIDKTVKRPPIGYMVNCAYPTFLQAESQPKELFERLIGFQANASSLDHCDLDGANELEANDVSDWGREMLKLNRDYGVRILGGCCGTGIEHLNYIVGN